MNPLFVIDRALAERSGDGFARAAANFEAAVVACGGNRRSDKAGRAVTYAWVLAEMTQMAKRRPHVWAARLRYLGEMGVEGWLL